MNKEIINNILQIEESFKLPEKLLKTLLSDEKEEIFTKFCMIGESLDHDWFTEYFEEEHANKSKMHQDFTPQCIADLVGDITREEVNSVADICAGTGGLTIGVWNQHPDATYHAEELSERAIPLLIFNMAIRNIEGEVVHKDVLTNEIKKVYRLKRGEKYSSIEESSEERINICDVAILNPPYSLKWNPRPDIRFNQYGLAPGNRADYAFIEHALSMLSMGGTAIAIMPTGILFRGSKEESIRKNLIKDNLIKYVIGLPEKLFMNTAIPVVVMILKKTNNDDGIFFIDAGKEYEKGKINIIRENHKKKIVTTLIERKEIDKFSHLALANEIEENEYNLNISRYVDTFEEPEFPDIQEVFKELGEIELEIVECENNLINMMHQMHGTNKKDDSEFRTGLQNYLNKRKESDELRNKNSQY